MAADLGEEFGDGQIQRPDNAKQHRQRDPTRAALNVTQVTGGHLSVSGHLAQRPGQLTPPLGKPRPDLLIDGIEGISP
ncbi:MAG: hypothetical protein OXL98_08260 [Acidimicrobiaceae bacterium]|nr:hypothetical protein [Acidimicrobiaceae bacterium]